ncbi:hypothetical protein M378DRAFT_162177 [Amanita muscaria Koide BX008]|uniref:Uncharacterized protein n=1 Tax=Amanita muscaria (strain Koide BX008) TaxID=946122 RepID=A0A0C2WU03_AMAMK|nr:hypothetical protein M378DRAFT_162177 [Amanita muscaria Koide BX008]
MYEENKKENVTTQALEEGKDKVFLEERTQDKYHFDPHDRDRVQRRLKQRHVQM